MQVLQYGLACNAPLVLDSSVTALAFTKFSCDKNDSTYVMAAGLEVGEIAIILWDSSEIIQEWKILKILSKSEGHHKAVKRLKFRPIAMNPNEYMLASCGEDNISKLHKIHLT